MATHILLNSLVVSTERPIQTTSVANANQLWKNSRKTPIFCKIESTGTNNKHSRSHESHLNQCHAHADAGQNQRLRLEHLQQLGHAAGLEGVRHVTIGLRNRQLFAAGRRQRIVGQMPVGRSVGAAALQLDLQQFPGLHIVLVVVLHALELGAHQILQLAVLHVAGNADAELAQEYDDQKDGELMTDDGRILL